MPFKNLQRAFQFPVVIKAHAFPLIAVFAGLGMYAGLQAALEWQIASLLFAPAIAVSLWYGGFWPALGATLLGAGAGAWLATEVPGAATGFADAADWVQLLLFSAIGSAVSAWGGIFKSIASNGRRWQLEQGILHAARHDALTGLPNRALVYECGSLLIAAAKRSNAGLAVLFFDLDRFKPINHTYGHEAGDRMLQEVAQRLRSHVRGSDLVGRLGGDEFVAILTDIESEQDLAQSAAHILAILRQPYQVDDLALRTSPSIGISRYPADGQDVDTLIRHADAAMHQAKESGRNAYQFFTPAIKVNSRRIFTIEQKMRQGIEQNAFVLHYQPIVDTRTRRIAGAEALIRWPQADGEMVMPNEFIPAAEASGIIHQLGDWVIREACRQHRLWQAQGLPALRIAVNVSPVQFRARHFYRHVAEAIASSAIDPGCLELEVTESTVMKQVQEAGKTMARLKDLGLHISLDDFGTGYSSLSHLTHLPFDKLKVDQSFIRHIETDHRALAIAETVIALGKKLGVKVVAEGIETEKTFELLRECHCDLGQGYLLSAPLPADRFARWHRENSVAAACL